MPQCRLETSRRLADRLDGGALFAPLHSMLVDLVQAKLGACKSRIVVIEGVHVADGAADNDMAHLEIGLLAGRTPEQKTALGSQALELLRETFAPIADGLNVSLSVRIVDMDHATYFK